MADSLEEELVQVAAVAVCWLESLGYTQEGALAAVRGERLRQDRKWGSQREQDKYVWAAILGEETGKVQKAVLQADGL